MELLITELLPSRILGEYCTLLCSTVHMHAARQVRDRSTPKTPHRLCLPHGHPSMCTATTSSCRISAQANNVLWQRHACLHHGHSSMCTATTSSCRISARPLPSRVAKLGCERPKSLRHKGREGLLLRPFSKLNSNKEFHCLCRFVYFHFFFAIEHSGSKACGLKALS